MITVRQLKAARALLNWSQSNLAKESGISIPTIGRLETADGPLGGRPETAEKLIAALEGAGIEFIGDVGLKLRRPKGRR